jgi:hypothetical protein
MKTRNPISSQHQNSLRHWFVFVLAAIATNYTFATQSSAVHRLELNGSGSLTLDSPVQHNGPLQLKATLSPGALSNDQPTLQTGNRFALTATLAASSLVCYSDTIFRDDFDADGL